MENILIEEKFNAAVNVIKTLPKDGPYQPSHDMMLQFYGLYKQATEGPCVSPKPSFYEVVKGYKWKAWSCLGNMSKMEAMNTYVEELKKIVETMSYSDNVAAFIESLGPFYEYVDIPSIKISDNNHNLTKKYSERNSSVPQQDSFEVITLCNGKGNNDNNSMHNGSIGNQDIPANVTNGVPSDNNINESNFNESSNETIPDNSQADSTISINGTEHIATIKRVPNDIDESDDEYLEPAETPELLRQKQQKQKVFKKDSPNAPVFLSDAGILTCGGGDDASAVGRIHFTQSQHGSQASRDGAANDEATSVPSMYPSVRGGGSGGRRGRDSDDPRPPGRGGSIDVNAQLILILQRIHQDLEAVVLRLDALETRSLAAHQQLCQLCQRRMGHSYHPKEKTSWWPFPELSPRTTFFILTWPLILPATIKLLLFLRSRRRKNF